MTARQAAVRWRNASQGQGSCVDLANTGTAVRDSKNPDGPVLKVGFSGLLAAVKSGQVRWLKSSRSGAQSDCVEASHKRDAIRDSKNPAVSLRADLDRVVDALKSGRITR